MKEWQENEDQPEEDWKINEDLWMFDESNHNG